MRVTFLIALFAACLVTAGCAQQSPAPKGAPQDRNATLQQASAVETFTAERPRLYPFPDGDLWGYVDEEGNIRIPPRFRDVGYFSAGLAPAREGGLYGYIDSTGRWAVEPRFEYATPFKGNVALVYPDGRPALMQRDGKVLMIAGAVAIRPSGEEDVWILQTASGREGLLSAGGNTITDTVFGNIAPFRSGRAVVTEWRRKDKKNDDGPQPLVGIIDAAGKLVVPFGKYSGLEVLAGGYIQASPPSRDDDRRYGVHYLHPSGRLIFSDTMSLNEFPVFEQAANGVVPVRYSQNGAEAFMGLHDTTGALLFRDQAVHDLTAYAHGVALASRSRYGDTMMLIDRSGRPVTQQVFSGAAFPPGSSVYKPSPFVHGTAVVILEGRLVLIDTAGRVLKSAPPVLHITDGRNLERRGNLVVYYQAVQAAGGDAEYRYGFWNTRTGVAVKPTYNSIEPDAYPGGPILAFDDDGRIVYLDENGRMIFHAPPRRISSDKPLNIAMMNRGYFYASGAPVTNARSLGGYGSSDNVAHAVSAVGRNAGAGPIVLRIESAAKPSQEMGCLVHEVVLSIASLDTMYFDAQDSRLYAVLQAKDATGAWRDIEYTPHSWCGNSYHTMALPPQHEWTFEVPHYDGAMQTTVRIKLSKAGLNAEQPTGEYFSNEVPMAVNPGQFWNKAGHSPTSIMDPYNE